MHAGTSSPTSVHTALENDSDDEMDWEEIAVPEVDASRNNDSERLESDVGLLTKLVPSQGPIEITIRSGKKKEDLTAKKRAEERSMRLTCHKFHTVALLCNALARNRWINDELLQARLLSMTPLSLQTSFQMITKQNQPNVAKRGRMFETAMMRLTQWWYEHFQVLDHGHIRSRTYLEVQKDLAAGFEDDEEDMELIRSPKSLMKHAILREGSRDVSAQLFTSLCRALGIPARLVVSIQGVPWQANVGKPAIKGKPKRKNTAEFDSSDVAIKDNQDEGDMEEVEIPSIPADLKGKGKMPHGGGPSTSTSKGAGEEKAPSAPVVKLRKSKSQGRKAGSGASSSSRRSTPAAPVGGYPPVFWTEVFSKPDHQWMPVDPIRYIVNKRRVFEPPPHDKQNRMVYVVAVEEDSYCRDVTPRYAKEYAAKTSKAQLGGKGRQEWWGKLMGAVTRPFRLQRDDIEDEEFETHQYREGMPTSVNGFKNHPLYILEQHLKRDEVIFPKTELGKFRGEPVYSRSNVVSLKTAENWMREGRKVKEGCQAMKMVKHRAATVHRKRAIELAQQEGEEVLQGLYARSQTELYIPNPIVDGIIPKNDFGNIDLYTPSMLPAGAAHIPYKGAMKIARRLGFDFAEAVTSFEFRKGRAIPVTTGIVVAAENEESVLDAYWEYERDAEAKESEKQKDRVIKRWARLIQGLRIRQRLKEQYEGDGHSATATAVFPHEADQEGGMEAPAPGGFVTEADAIVQPFYLPKFEHGTYQSSGDPFHKNSETKEGTENFGPSSSTAHNHSSNQLALEVETPSRNIDSEDTATRYPHYLKKTRPPRTMLEMAQEAASRQTDSKSPPPVESHNGPRQTFTKAAPRKRESIQGTNVESHVDKLEKRRRGNKKSGQSNARNGGHTSSESEAELEDQDEEGSHSSSSSAVPSKRKHSEKSVSPVKSDRVLRTRTPKTAKQIEEERKARAAYRRAIMQ